MKPVVALLLAVLVLVSGSTRKTDVSAGRASTISVPGIPGPYCAYGIEKRLREAHPVDRIEIDWEAEEIRVVAKPGEPISTEDIRRAVEASDYPYDYTVR